MLAIFPGGCTAALEAHVLPGFLEPLLRGGPARVLLAEASLPKGVCSLLPTYFLGRGETSGNGENALSGFHLMGQNLVWWSPSCSDWLRPTTRGPGAMGTQRAPLLMGP